MSALDWSPDAILTEAHAKELMRRGACSTALTYVGWTVEAAAAAEPWTALRCAAALLTPERLDACAAAEPWAALRYAAALVTPERLDACAAADPLAALQYAAALVTPERLHWCREQMGKTP